MCKPFFNFFERGCIDLKTWIKRMFEDKRTPIRFNNDPDLNLEQNRVGYQQFLESQNKHRESSSWVKTFINCSK